MSEKAQKKAIYQHLFIPIALIAILAIMLFPMPSMLLDICLAINITASLIVLFVSLYMDKPLHFSSFPAVLLITTLFRLGMNIAATRLILLYGQGGMDAAGHVIQAFGEFVIGGNYIIGIIIFIAISIVNLKVITKGSGRIAEVAARFTLDAMPGKQMAIDSDLNSGLINETEAKNRRKEIAQEAEFYGAMDGAAKFVAGDATAGVFITGINIIGGLFLGIVYHDMNWMLAAQTYTVLTIGDGLVAQIPSLIISVASGLIVARAASGDDLGSEVLGQLSQSAKPMLLASGVCMGMAILPGMPFLPFCLLGIGAGALGLMKQKILNEQKLKKTVTDTAKDPKTEVKPGSTEEVTQLLAMDTLELEVGFELVQLVEGGDLVERIRSVRRQFATDYGFILPAIHIRDNVRIGSSEYRLMLKGQVIGASTLKTRHLLAMDPGTVTNPISGTPTKEPAFGLDAVWILETEKERAQFAGYTVVDLTTVITTHLTEILRTHMHELLGRQEVQHLIDNLSRNAPKVIEELVPSQLTVGQVQQVLCCLLREQVSIRDLRTICETMADWAAQVKNPEKLAELVRRKLSRAITAKFQKDDGVLPLTSLNPAVERTLSDSVQQTDDGSFLALDPGYAQQLIGRLSKAAEKFHELGATPLVLAPGHIRPALAHFVERFVPGVCVISHHEIAPNTKVQSLGVIAVE